MAPSEETTSATCSQQQVSPKIQQGAATSREENIDPVARQRVPDINSSSSDSNINQTVDISLNAAIARNVDQVVDCITSVRNIDSVEDSMKSVDSTCVDCVDKLVDGPKKVVGNVENPKCVNSAEVVDSPEVSASVPKQQVANTSTQAASRATATDENRDSAEATNEGCADKQHRDGLCIVEDEQSCDGDEDDDVREKCLLLLKELVSQAAEASQQKRECVQHIEGGPVRCRLPLAKVSLALQSCKSGTNSALVQSPTKQYSQQPNSRVHETGASCKSSPLDSFEESTPPSVFQGRKTMTVDPSLPSTPDESSSTPFTPSSTQVPGSPSIAMITPSSSSTALGPLCVPLCPKTPCSSSSFLEGEGRHKSPSQAAVVVHNSTSTVLPVPRRFLFQVEPVHQMKLSDGQKLFACDICSGVYQRCFSLKRHYLRAHINHRYLTERDISNCGIVVSDRPTKETPTSPMDVEVCASTGLDDVSVTSGVGSPRSETAAENCVVFPSLYRCHLCSLCYDSKNELKCHLSTHKPVAPVNIKEKTVSKLSNSNRQGRSKSLPEFKNSDKERNRSPSAVSQDLSSLVQVPSLPDYNLLSEDTVLKSLTSGIVSNAMSVGESTALTYLTKMVTSDQLVPLVSKICVSPSRSLKSTVTSHEASSFIADILPKLGTPMYSSKSLIPDHSSNLSAAVHSTKSATHSHSPKSSSPSSSKHSSPSHSLNSPKSSSPSSSKHSSPSHSLNSPKSSSPSSSKHSSPSHSLKPSMSSYSPKPGPSTHSPKSYSFSHLAVPSSHKQLLNLSLPCHSSKHSASSSPSKQSHSSKLSPFCRAQDLSAVSHASKPFTTSSYSVPAFLDQLSNLMMPSQLLKPEMFCQMSEPVMPLSLNQFSKPLSPSPSSPKCSSSERDQYLCLYCDKTFSTSTMHKRHVSRSHPQQSHAQLALQNNHPTPHHKCAYCTKPGGTFSELPQLVQHLVATHSDVYHACTTCELRFDSKVALDHHLSETCHKESATERVNKQNSPGLRLNALSRSAPDVRDEGKSSQQNADILGGGSEFLYTCSICRQVFNDYVAMCRHHRQVHKGKRSLNTLLKDVRSPSDSRSQSPFVIPEKVSSDQAQGRDKEAKSEELSRTFVPQDLSKKNSDNKAQSSLLMLPEYQGHIDGVLSSQHSSNLNKDGIKAKVTCFKSIPTDKLEKETTSLTSQDHRVNLPTSSDPDRLRLLGYAVDLSIKTCNSINKSDSVSHVGNKTCILSKNCELVERISEHDSSGKNGEFFMRSDSNFLSYQAEDNKSANDVITSKQEGEGFPSSVQKISDKSHTSSDCITTKKPVPIEAGNGSCSVKISNSREESDTVSSVTSPDQLKTHSESVQKTLPAVKISSELVDSKVSTSELLSDDTEVSSKLSLLDDVGKPETNPKSALPILSDSDVPECDSAVPGHAKESLKELSNSLKGSEKSKQKKEIEVSGKNRNSALNEATSEAVESTKTSKKLTNTALSMESGQKLETLLPKVADSSQREAQAMLSGITNLAEESPKFPLKVPLHEPDTEASRVSSCVEDDGSLIIKSSDSVEKDYKLLKPSKSPENICKSLGPLEQQMLNKASSSIEKYLKDADSVNPDSESLVSQKRSSNYKDKGSKNSDGSRKSSKYSDSQKMSYKSKEKSSKSLQCNVEKCSKNLQSSGTTTQRSAYQEKTKHSKLLEKITDSLVKASDNLGYMKNVKHADSMENSSEPSETEKSFDSEKKYLKSSDSTKKEVSNFKKNVKDSGFVENSPTCSGSKEKSVKISSSQEKSFRHPNHMDKNSKNLSSPEKTLELASSVVKTIDKNYKHASSSEASSRHSDYKGKDLKSSNLPEFSRHSDSKQKNSKPSDSVSTKRLKSVRKRSKSKDSVKASKYLNLKKHLKVPEPAAKSSKCEATQEVTTILSHDTEVSEHSVSDVAECSEESNLSGKSSELLSKSSNNKHSTVISSNFTQDKPECIVPNTLDSTEENYNLSKSEPSVCLEKMSELVLDNRELKSASPLAVVSDSDKILPENKVSSSVEESDANSTSSLCKSPIAVQEIVDPQMGISNKTSLMEEICETDLSKSSTSVKENGKPVSVQNTGSLEETLKTAAIEIPLSYQKDSSLETSESVEQNSNFASAGVLSSMGKTSKCVLVKEVDSVKENIKYPNKETTVSVDEVSEFVSSKLQYVEENLNSVSSEILDSEEIFKSVPSEILDSEEISKSESIDTVCSREKIPESEAIEFSLSLKENSKYSSVKILDSIEKNLNSIEESSASEDIEMTHPDVENLEPASVENTDSVGERCKFADTTVLDSVQENSKSLSLEMSSCEQESSKSTVVENSDVVGELSKPSSANKGDPLQEDSTFIASKVSDSAQEKSDPESSEIPISKERDLKSVSVEVSHSIEENVLNAELTEISSSDQEDSKSFSDYIYLEDSSKSVSDENSESLEKNSKPALTENSCFAAVKSPLSESLISVKEICDSLGTETTNDTSLSTQSEGSAGKAEAVLTEVSNEEHGNSHSADRSEVKPKYDEQSPKRVLKRISTVTQCSDSAEENDSMPLQERLLRSRNESVEKESATGRSRVLRSSLAASQSKSADPVVDSNDNVKVDSNRVLRSSITPKSEEPAAGYVEQDAAADVELSSSKSRTKLSPATGNRGTRLRKFSRRIRSDQVQEEQHLDPETLFYCRIAGNIRDNLLHHLDGKLELEEVAGTSRSVDKTNSSVPEGSVSTSQEEKHHHHHRVPWEKYNFPKKYDGRCGEGAVCLASYIKDMSHLDISTQLMMRQNLQRLISVPTTTRSLVDLTAEASKNDVVCFSKGLSLNVKTSAETPRRRSLRSAANRGRELLVPIPGGAASTFTASASLKNWASADDVSGANTTVELSGEWVRPRNYICAACGIMFGDLWDLEDHKYSQHPNVWCTHYEFDQAALEETIDKSRSHGGSSTTRELCRRFLLVRDSVESVPPATLTSEVKCTKCEKGFTASPELHRHILECGGDTTWMLFPSPTATGRRPRKWRPFGSRRRRQQSSHRRGMKRNIPTTPMKQYYKTKHSAMRGDSDSIQRMLANLPAKRSTRRVIQFSEDEIKTRSQGTIHSNRLLRKRYKVSFASGGLRSPHKVGHKLRVRTISADLSDAAAKKLIVRSTKKLSVVEQKRQLAVKRLTRSRSTPIGTASHSKSSIAAMNRRNTRGGRSLPPSVTQSESTSSETPVTEPKQLVLHKSRSRKKKITSSSVVEHTEEPVQSDSKQNENVGESGLNVDNSETSNILAAMRIAMLEGVVTDAPPSGDSTKKVIKKLPTKKQLSAEEKKSLSPGKRKKISTGETTTLKKKVKLSQLELEERFLRNKGYTHPDETTDEPIICKGCGLQFDSGSAELRHRKTCIYVSPNEEMISAAGVENVHACSSCGERFSSVCDLLQHTAFCKPIVNSKKAKGKNVNAEETVSRADEVGTTSFDQEIDITRNDENINKNSTTQSKTRVVLTVKKKQLGKKYNKLVVTSKKLGLKATKNPSDVEESDGTNVSNMTGALVRKVGKAKGVKITKKFIRRKNVLSADGTSSSAEKQVDGADIVSRTSDVDNTENCESKGVPDLQANVSNASVITKKTIGKIGKLGSSLSGRRKTLITADLKRMDSPAGSKIELENSCDKVDSVKLGGDNIPGKVQKQPDSVQSGNESAKSKKKLKIGVNKMKQRSSSVGTVAASSNRMKKKQGNVIGSGMKKKLGKCGSTGNISVRGSETGGDHCSPVGSDIDDRMPELQKEEPIENLKTQTPSPKIGEDLCDIPILSPIVCDAQGEDNEEKKSSDIEMTDKNVVSQGKKQPKAAVKTTSDLDLEDIFRSVIEMGQADEEKVEETKAVKGKKRSKSAPRQSDDSLLEGMEVSLIDAKAMVEETNMKHKKKRLKSLPRKADELDLEDVFRSVIGGYEQNEGIMTVEEGKQSEVTDSVDVKLTGAENMAMENQEEEKPNKKKKPMKTVDKKYDLDLEEIFQTVIQVGQIEKEEEECGEIKVVEKNRSKTVKKKCVDLDLEEVFRAVIGVDQVHDQMNEKVKEIENEKQSEAQSEDFNLDSKSVADTEETVEKTQGDIKIVQKKRHTKTEVTNKLNCDVLLEKYEVNLEQVSSHHQEVKTVKKRKKKKKKSKLIKQKITLQKKKQSKSIVQIVENVDNVEVLERGVTNIKLVPEQDQKEILPAQRKKRSKATKEKPDNLDNDETLENVSKNVQPASEEREKEITTQKKKCSKAVVQMTDILDDVEVLEGGVIIHTESVFEQCDKETTTQRKNRSKAVIKEINLDNIEVLESDVTNVEPVLKPSEKEIKTVQRKKRSKVMVQMNDSADIVEVSESNVVHKGSVSEQSEKVTTAQRRKHLKVTVKMIGNLDAEVSETGITNSELFSEQIVKEVTVHRKKRSKATLKMIESIDDTGVSERSVTNTEPVSEPIEKDIMLLQRNKACITTVAMSNSSENVDDSLKGVISTELVSEPTEKKIIAPKKKRSRSLTSNLEVMQKETITTEPLLLQNDSDISVQRRKRSKSAVKMTVSMENVEILEDSVINSEQLPVQNKKEIKKVRRNKRSMVMPQASDSLDITEVLGKNVATSELILGENYMEATPQINKPYETDVQMVTSLGDVEKDPKYTEPVFHQNQNEILKEKCSMAKIEINDNLEIEEQLEKNIRKPEQVAKRKEVAKERKKISKALVQKEDDLDLKQMFWKDVINADKICEQDQEETKAQVLEKSEDVSLATLQRSVGNAERKLNEVVRNKPSKIHTTEAINLKAIEKNVLNTQEMTSDKQHGANVAQKSKKTKTVMEKIDSVFEVLRRNSRAGEEMMIQSEEHTEMVGFQPIAQKPDEFEREEKQLTEENQELSNVAREKMQLRTVERKSYYEQVILEKNVVGIEELVEQGDKQLETVEKRKRGKTVLKNSYTVDLPGEKVFEENVTDAEQSLIRNQRRPKTVVEKKKRAKSLVKSANSIEFEALENSITDTNKLFDHNHDEPETVHTKKQPESRSDGPELEATVESNASNGETLVEQIQEGLSKIQNEKETKAMMKVLDDVDVEEDKFKMNMVDAEHFGKPLQVVRKKVQKKRRTKTMAHVDVVDVQETLDNTIMDGNQMLEKNQVDENVVEEREMSETLVKKADNFDLEGKVLMNDLIAGEIVEQNEEDTKALKPKKQNKILVKTITFKQSKTKVRFGNINVVKKGNQSKISNALWTESDEDMLPMIEASAVPSGPRIVSEETGESCTESFPSTELYTTISNEESSKIVESVAPNETVTVTASLKRQRRKAFRRRRSIPIWDRKHKKGSKPKPPDIIDEDSNDDLLPIAKLKEVIQKKIAPSEDSAKQDDSSTCGLTDTKNSVIATSLDADSEVLGSNNFFVKCLETENRVHETILVHEDLTVGAGCDLNQRITTESRRKSFKQEKEERRALSCRGRKSRSGHHRGKRKTSLPCDGRDSSEDRIPLLLERETGHFNMIDSFDGNILDGTEEFSSYSVSAVSSCVQQEHDMREGSPFTEETVGTMVNEIGTTSTIKYEETEVNHLKKRKKMRKSSSVTTNEDVKLECHTIRLKHVIGSKKLSYRIENKTELEGNYEHSTIDKRKMQPSADEKEENNHVFAEGEKQIVNSNEEDTSELHNVCSVVGGEVETASGLEESDRLEGTCMTMDKTVVSNYETYSTKSSTEKRKKSKRKATKLINDEKTGMPSTETENVNLFGEKEIISHDDLCNLIDQTKALCTEGEKNSADQNDKSSKLDKVGELETSLVVVSDKEVLTTGNPSPVEEHVVVPANVDEVEKNDQTNLLASIEDVPLRQARRTRCNTSYEELYTWSDVTTETEDSSQDLPDANILAALCQDTDASVYDDIVAMIADNEQFFPSASKKKKKRKLRNNSRQYRNGQLRKKRRRRQKLRAKIVKKPKRSPLNEFIVTDIETGQDSCESTALAETRTHQTQELVTESVMAIETKESMKTTETDTYVEMTTDIATETGLNVKSVENNTNMKSVVTVEGLKIVKKKRRTQSMVNLLEKNDTTNCIGDGKPKKKRKSSVGSQYFCTLCNKHYSTNYNLEKHRLSLVHRKMSQALQSSMEYEQSVSSAQAEELPSSIIENMETELLSSAVIQSMENEDLSSSLFQIMDTESSSALQSFDTEMPSSSRMECGKNMEIPSFATTVKNVLTEELQSAVLTNLDMQELGTSFLQGVATDEFGSSIVQADESNELVEEVGSEKHNPSVVQRVETNELGPSVIERVDHGEYGPSVILGVRTDKLNPSVFQRENSEKCGSSFVQGVGTDERGSCVVQGMETEKFSSSVVQGLETEEVSSSIQELETVEHSSSIVQGIETEELSSSIVQGIETDELSSSIVQGLETDEVSCSAVQAMGPEKFSSSIQRVDIAKCYSSVIREVLSEEPCSVVQNVQTELPSSSVQIMETSSYDKNFKIGKSVSINPHFEIKEICSPAVQGTEPQTDRQESEQSSTSVIETKASPFPSKGNSASRVTNFGTEQVLQSFNQVSSSIKEQDVLGMPHTNVFETSRHGVASDDSSVLQGARNEAMTGSSFVNSASGTSSEFCHGSSHWTVNQVNMSSDWLGKEGALQQGAENWPSSDAAQKQQGWLEGQANSNQWLYMNQWPQEVSWTRDGNPDVAWNADSSQEDGTFFQSSSASLGSILDSVNQILDNDRSADRLSPANEYQQYVDFLQPGSMGVDPSGDLRELQHAMGATDEEMAMLQQLGEGNWPLEDADIMDLDNQNAGSAAATAPAAATDIVTRAVAAASTSATSATSSASCSTAQKELQKSSLAEKLKGRTLFSPSMIRMTLEPRTLTGRGGLRNQDVLLARYESKDMVCPVCSRRYLGLTALRAHLAAAHNSSTRHRTQTIPKRQLSVSGTHSSESGRRTRHVCVVCKELLPNEQGLADHVGVAHVDRQSSLSKPNDVRTEGVSSGGSSSAEGGDQELRSHMTSALGGLLTRALNNFLGKNRSHPSPPTPQTPSPPATSPRGNCSPLLTQSVSSVLNQRLNVTARRHSSGPIDEQPFNCDDCDVRFDTESNRNRHVAKAHRLPHLRRLSTDSSQSRSDQAAEQDSRASPIISSNIPAVEPEDSNITLTSTVDSAGNSSEKSVLEKIHDDWQPSAEESDLRKEDHAADAVPESQQVSVDRVETVLKDVDQVSVEKEHKKMPVSSNKSVTNSGKPEGGDEVSHLDKSERAHSGLRNMNGVDEDAIKAKAVAALRALSTRKRTRNGFLGAGTPSMWSVVSRKKSKGLDSEERFKFPVVRKTPPTVNRFTSLAEKKKKTLLSPKCEVSGHSKENDENVGQNSAFSGPDVYEFQDELEQVEPLSEFGLRGSSSTAISGKIAAQQNSLGSSSDTGENVPLHSLNTSSGSKDLDSIPASTKALDDLAVRSKTAKTSSRLEVEENSVMSEVRTQALTVSQIIQKNMNKVIRTHKSPKTLPRSKHIPSDRRHESNKKKKWHRIIVDSGEETSDADMVTDVYRRTLDNQQENETSDSSEQRNDEGRCIKRRRVMPCLSGVLVEDRQCKKRTKTAKQPSKGGSKRSTKTDLLMSVFAKSRQRIISSNAATTVRTVPPKPSFCSTYVPPYRSIGSYGNIGGAESESDSGSLATSCSTGNATMSSDDERTVRGKTSQQRKQKRGRHKTSSL